MRDLYKRLGVSMTEGAERIRSALRSFRDEEFRRDCERVLLEPEARGAYDRNLRLLHQIAEARKDLGIVETAHWNRGIQDEFAEKSPVAPNRSSAVSKSSSSGWAMWLIGFAGWAIVYLYFSGAFETDHSRFAKASGELEQSLQHADQTRQSSVRRTVPLVPEPRNQDYATPSPSVSNPTIPSFRIESLSAFRLKEERSKYDDSVHAVNSQELNSTDDAIHRVNWSYVKLLESRQRNLPKSAGLYQAYDREIQMVKFYASRPPYIVDIGAISRENVADRLTPERNSYSESIKSLRGSKKKIESREETAAVTLILATKTVIKEIQSRYSGSAFDRNALIEEFRILQAVIPKDSANFKSLRAELELVQNEMLKPL